MSNPFAPIPPCRVRFESAAISLDRVSSCALIVVPDEAGSVQLLTQSQHPQQMVSLYAAVFAHAIASGLAGHALQAVMASGLPGLAIDSLPIRDVPPDDLPQHLRKDWKPPPKPGGG